MKYHDQTNINSMKNMLNTNNANLMRARLFQHNYVKTWNSNALEVSQMLYLELSKFDEISSDCCIQVLDELLHDFGLIEKDINRDGHYVTIDKLDQRRVRIYGDCLSMDKIWHMENRIYSVVTHPENQSL